MGWRAMKMSSEATEPKEPEVAATAAIEPTSVECMAMLTEIHTMCKAILEKMECKHKAEENEEVITLYERR